MVHWPSDADGIDCLFVKINAPRRFGGVLSGHGVGPAKGRLVRSLGLLWRESGYEKLTNQCLQRRPLGREGFPAIRRDRKEMRALRDVNNLYA